MKKIGIFLALILALSGQQQTYFENNPRGSCESCLGMNPEVDFQTNHISHGDFESPVIPSDKPFIALENIPSWTTGRYYEINRCSNI